MMKKTGLALTISIILGLTGCSGGSGGGGSNHANLPKDNTVVINPKPQSNTSTTTSTARLADNAVDTPAESTIDTASNTEKATAEENITHVHLTPDPRSRRIIHGGPKGNEGYGYKDIARQETPVNENSENTAETVADSTPHFFPDRRPPRIRSRRSVDATSSAGGSDEAVVAEVASTTSTATTTTPTPATPIPENKPAEKVFANGKKESELPKVPGAKPVSSTTDAYDKTRTVYDNGRVIYSYPDGYWTPVITAKKEGMKPKLDGLSFITEKQAEQLLSELKQSVDDVSKSMSSTSGDYVLGYGIDATKDVSSSGKYEVKIKKDSSGTITVTAGDLNQPIDADDLAKNQNMYDFVNGSGTPAKFLVNVGGDSYLGSNGKELLAFGVKSAEKPSSNLNYKGQSIIWTKTGDGQGSYHIGGFTGTFNTTENKFTGNIDTINDENNHLSLKLEATINDKTSFTGKVTIEKGLEPSWKDKQLQFDGQFNGTESKGTSGIIYTNSSTDGAIKGKIGGVYAGSASEKTAK